MTDRELLLENNAKLKTIQETLKNKILALTDKGIEVELPETFHSCTYVYNLRLDENTFLFSGASSMDVGIWLYDMRSKTFSQLYTLGSGFGIFYELEDVVLIISNDSNKPGVLLYDKNTKSVSQLLTYGSGRTYFARVENKVLISGGNVHGLWVYDISTRQISVKGTGMFGEPFQIEDNWFVSNTNYTKGLYAYDAIEDKFTAVLSDGWYWRVVTKIKDKYLLSANATSTGSVVLYNPADKTFTPLYDAAEKWFNYLIVGDKVLLSSSSTTSATTFGVLLYDSNSETIQQIYGYGSYWNIFYQVSETKYLIITSYSGGILLYNSYDDSIKQVYSGGISWSNIIKVTDTKFLLNSTNKNYTGILEFDLTTEVCTKIYNNQYNWEYMQVVRDMCLLFTLSNSSYTYFAIYDGLNGTISAQSNTGGDLFIPIGDTQCIILCTTKNGYVYFYDAELKTLTKTSAPFAIWKYVQKVKNGYLIGSSVEGDTPKTNGLLFFNESTKELSKIYGYGCYGTFIPDGDNYYVKVENPETNSKTHPRTLYYNSTDNSAKLVKYYIGEI